MNDTHDSDAMFDDAMPATGESVMTVRELCRRWRCDRRAVLEAIHADRLHAFRIGKRGYRIALAEVERFERTRAA